MATPGWRHVDESYTFFEVFGTEKLPLSIYSNNPTVMSRHERKSHVYRHSSHVVVSVRLFVCLFVFPADIGGRKG